MVKSRDRENGSGRAEMKGECKRPEVFKMLFEQRDSRMVMRG